MERIIEHPQVGESGREIRGFELFREGYFERISRNVFLVINTERGTIHIVDVGHGTCDCTDYERHAHIQGFRCYHLIGAGHYRDWLREGTRALAPYFGNAA